MHFWIDKRSQCGYSGRRVPSSVSAGGGRPRRERHLKRMVTPVHRFQSIECVPGTTRRPPGTSHIPRVQQHQQPNTSSFNNLVINNGPLYPSNGNVRSNVEVDSNVYLEMPHAESARVETAPAIPPSPPLQLMPDHLKCGMWASFALATMFVAGAKFYFDRQIVYEQGTGMEILGLCALIVIFLLGGCTISLCRARTLPPIPVVTIPPISPRNHSQNSHEELALSTILSLQVPNTAGPLSPEPPPPPYHIAVLLPQCNVTETPPPTYEKAVS